jgi:hypothetical protein
MHSKLKMNKVTPQGLLQVWQAFQLKLKEQRKWKLNTGFARTALLDFWWQSVISLRLQTSS